MIEPPIPQDIEEPEQRAEAIQLATIASSSPTEVADTDAQAITEHVTIDLEEELLQCMEDDAQGQEHPPPSPPGRPQPPRKPPGPPQPPRTPPPSSLLQAPLPRHSPHGITLADRTVAPKAA